MKHFLFRWRAVLASTIASSMLLPALSVSAALTHYTDVESGAWYEESAAALLSSGALNASEARLRPHDLATRAEVFKLLVDLNDRLLEYPAKASFSDVSRTAWYFPYIEAAAKAGWIRGDNDCYGRGFVRCTARPADPVNRAEMAIILQRAFALSYLGAAPVFPDVAVSNWYFTSVQTAADHCILQGDSNTGLVRPASFMNRAEMIVMFDRARQDLRYGEDCGIQPEPIGSIDTVNVVSGDTLRVTFNVDLDPNREDDIDRYMLERTSDDTDVGINDVAVINARTVELRLDAALMMGAQYRLGVENMRTRGGAVFSDTLRFTSDKGDDETRMMFENVTVLSTTRLRLAFSGNLDKASAENETHYRVADNSGNLDIGMATLTGGMMVELVLEDALQSQQSYTVTVTGLQGSNGTIINGAMSFIYGVSSVQFTASLSGANEVPSVSTSATGTGTFTLTSTGLQYDITVRNMSGSSMTGAHFHRGAVGVEGPVIESIAFNGLHASGTWTDLTAQERDDLLDGRMYVNVHTIAYPDGEIRGQVVR